MASRQPNDVRPEEGEILVVIHDFQARSSDELSLVKGDEVKLTQRDDDYNDGWFLGTLLKNDNSGLFPEVYTRPKGALKSAASASASQAHTHPSNGAIVESESQSPRPASSALPPVSQPTPQPITASSLHGAQSSVTLPLNSTIQETRSVSAPTPQAVSKPISYGPGPDAAARLNPSSSQDSQVLHETLTVIDEHITDLHSPPQNGLAHHATDSGSEYSSQMQDRLSYIQGEETDEEEDAPHSRLEVEAWGADDVAEYLFTMGVEKKHCEVFRDQEIAGEVLLNMDQSSLFLKAFDLGSVGRRLKTWQRIKALQDEVNGNGIAVRRQTYGSDAGSEDSRATGRRRSRTSTLTNAQRLSPIEDRPTSIHAKRLSQTPRMEAMMPGTPNSPGRILDSPTRPSHQKRPSAASVRDLHHSRRHSSTDFRLTVNPPAAAMGTPKLPISGTFPQAETTHKKQPSFDRNWTMGAPPGQQPPRPLSSTGFQEIANASDLDVSQQDLTADLDRGYFSGTELDGRRRNVLKKRDSVASHSHQSSYAEQQRVRSATALSRRSRFGSADFNRDTTPPSATQMYYGTAGDHQRATSTTTTDSYRPPPPAKDGPSPTVTKLDGGARASPSTLGPRQGDWLSNASGKIAGFGGLRAISDAVTGADRSKFHPPTDFPIKDSPLQSPTRTGTSTPSAGPSFDLESPDARKSPYSATTPGSRKSGKKNKQETSAYLRGLQKIGPRDAIKDADYSGWMKKKNSHLMTTWKPRLFVLRGRRLSYYYSEDDAEEKGLIDISFHRVLPADNERLTGLHATLTGASNTPMTPADSNLPTLAEKNAAAGAAIEKGSDSMFIFKLMPPRAGLSKAVNFTKPTVHYFAVPNLQQGRAWMAALMKATIDRDDSQPMTSTYQQKTISLAKARQMRHRPPALMNLDEKIAESVQDDDDEKKGGLGISFGEVDSAVSGLEKSGSQKAAASATILKSTFSSETGDLSFAASPQSA